jgi:hypothetical protein
MSIQSNDPRLSAYVLGELKGSDLKEFEALLAKSPEAQETVNSLRSLSGRLKTELGNEPLPPGLKKASSLRIPLLIIVAIFSVSVFFLVDSGFFTRSPRFTSEPKRIAKWAVVPPTQTNSEVSQPEADQQLGLSGENAIVPANINKDDLQSVLKSRETELRHCYQAEMQRSSYKSGKLTLYWKVGSKQHAEVTQSAFGNEMSSCVLDVLKEAELSPSGGGVEYPIYFMTK